MLRAQRVRPTIESVPWLTMTVCAVAVIVFAVASPSPHGGTTVPGLLAVIEAGARATALVADANEGWRLLSCHFVHTSRTHLLFNLAFLFPVGAALEQVLWRRDYATLLMCVGAASGLASLLGTPQVSAGASGLVFGVLGGAVAIGLRHNARLPQRVRLHFGGAVLPFLVIVGCVSATNAGVDHANHAGGLVAGLALGFALPLRGDAPLSVARPVAALVMLVMLAWAAPSVAAGGRRSARVELADGSSLVLPPGWRSRYGPVGEVEFTSAGGLVVLTIDHSPSGTPGQRTQWYVHTRLAPQAPAGRVVGLSGSAPRSVTTARTSGSAVRFAFDRDGVAMVRDVFFLAGTTVMSLELPRAWASRYNETREAIVGSIQPGGAPQGLPPTVRAAAR